MKTFTSLVIACGLGLAGSALAQQPEAETSPKPKKEEKGKPPQHQEHQQQVQQSAANPQATTAPGKPEAGANAHKAKTTEKSDAAAGANPQPNTTMQTNTSPTPGGKQQGGRGNKAVKNESGSPSAMPEGTPMPNATPVPVPIRGKRNAAEKTASAPPAATVTATPKATATASPTAVATATAAATASATAAPGATASAAPSAAQTNTAATGAPVKKPDPQKVEQIKTQHADFHAQPKPQVAPAVTFNANHRIEGSDRWQGQQYEVFRSYHPERHDEGWYHSHYQRVELIGGGYYFWNNGYWYPAWGYSQQHEYYAYDGPIYVGRRAAPLDRVIADVQAVLKDMGYYKGEVDGLLGPLTREALTGYQAENGLTQTAAIDEPTLDALDMSS